MKPSTLLCPALALVALAACQPQSETGVPDRPTLEETEQAPAPRIWDKGAMVAAADPRAVEAGLKILREGGTAIDAAIAVHSVLGLVEPQSSGIGGGAFMVYYDFEDDALTVFDGRETAPQAADENLFVIDGEVLDSLHIPDAFGFVNPEQPALQRYEYQRNENTDYRLHHKLS